MSSILKKYLLVVFFIFSPALSAHAADISATFWQVKKSTHFVIYYQEAPSDYINEVIDRAEGYYNTITTKLGFTRYEEFWTWYKRAKIYLFRNKEEYNRITSQPEWTRAYSRVIAHEIYTYVRREGFFETVLPHELGHIIFREFIGYDKRLPLWIDEGVAMFCERGNTSEGTRMTRVIARTVFFMDMQELGGINRANLMMPEIFYAEADSVMEFLIKEYGNDKFAEFCLALKNLKEKETWEDAICSVYKFNSIQELNDAWIKFFTAYRSSQ